MNCLVTGGTGFVGTSLARFLVERGDRVTVLRTDCPNRPEGEQHHCKNEEDNPCSSSCWSGVTPQRLVGICREMLLS